MSCLAENDPGELSTVFFSLQGNLEFVDNDEEQASVVNSDENLNVIAYLLGSEPRHVEKALCYRVVAAGQNEVVDKGHHATDAAHGRDALAKVIIVLLAMMGIYYHHHHINNKNNNNNINDNTTYIAPISMLPLSSALKPQETFRSKNKIKIIKILWFWTVVREMGNSSV